MNNQANKCATCGETIVSVSSGSLTAWIFRQAQCRCERNLLAKAAPSQAAPVQSAPAATVGQVIADRYQILELLGSGGMGTVYKVIDRSSQTVCALKCISNSASGYDSIQKRLQHEAAAIKALHHQNIVSMLDEGRTADGANFIVMDFVAGVNLASVVAAEGRLKEDRALNIFIQIAEALQHAHENGVVHRDLKPSNILLMPGVLEDDRVRIIDFGIAKVLPTGSIDMTKLSLTQTGELLGSPLYMSPEQCRGDELDGRSDIYSCGCTMYEALAGSPPFVGDNPVRVILKHVADVPPSFPKGVAVTTDLQDVILKCLEKKPDSRYQSAAELLSDLHQIEHGHRIMRSKSNRTKQPNQPLITAALSVLVVVAAGAVVSFSSNQHHEIPAPSVKNNQPVSAKAASTNSPTVSIDSGNDESGSEAVREAVQGRNNIDLSTLGIAFNIKDADLQAIKENQIATTANLKGLTSVTDKGLDALSHLPLTRLVINNTDTANLQALHDMAPTLTYLSANGINLNEQGVQNILKLKRLQSLMIANTPISDKQLAKLETLKNLRYLDIKYCPNISTTAVDLLKEHMKSCDISYRPPLSPEEQKADELFLRAHQLEASNDLDAARSEIDRALEIGGLSSDMRKNLRQTKSEILRKMHNSR